MKTIWKFELPRKGVSFIELREGYEILALQIQRDIPCIWVLLDSAKPERTEQFELWGTGHLIPENREYVGTWQEHGRELVWHLFKVVEL